MIFEFSPGSTFDFVSAFAHWQEVAVSGQQVLMPETFGEGSIRRVDVEEGMTVYLHAYTPREEFVLRRLPPVTPVDRVTLIFFRSKLPPGRVITPFDSELPTQPLQDECAAEISSNDLQSTFQFPAGRKIDFIVVGIATELLRKYLATAATQPVVQTIVGGQENSFLYYLKIWPELHRAIDHLSELNERESLGKLQFKIRVEELIYLLFHRLIDRTGNTKQSPVSNDVLLEMQSLKADLISDLSSPPDLSHLSRKYGMGQTLLSSVFRQVFGSSIYQFFQSQRMEEAAYLLRHTPLPVGEIGFRLGFVNLSHFSRLFKKHYGETPKRFASGG